MLSIGNGVVISVSKSTEWQRRMMSKRWTGTVNAEGGIRIEERTLRVEVTTRLEVRICSGLKLRHGQPPYLISCTLCASA